ncbi:myelin basic protein-like [Chanos chanos]|uniref:Myelin basic protein n=1 Tax=Chanos chanos TaxID=29144 RepID=A0A6J2W0Z2_CHACN|nr:myelin basic protein-like [Chanos chanos]
MKRTCDDVDEDDDGEDDYGLQYLLFKAGKYTIVSMMRLKSMDNPCCFCAGLGEADVNQNNGCPSKTTALTDSTGAEGPHGAWNPSSTADPNATGPRPHLARLFSRDAPGREDNTFKDRPSESDELQTIHEQSGTGSECGLDCGEQDDN